MQIKFLQANGSLLYCYGQPGKGKAFGKPAAVNLSAFFVAEKPLLRFFRVRINLPYAAAKGVLPFVSDKTFYILQGIA